MTFGQSRAPGHGLDRAYDATPWLQAIAYGILAPNPHNTQAWRFQPLSDSEALLFIDERRLLPATDPPARQVHVGAGCCIETLAVGMSVHGFGTEVEYLPLGAHGLSEIGRKPVAKLALVPDPSARPDVLAEFIPLRQTNRKPYTGPLLSPDDAAKIRSQVESDAVELLIINQPEQMRPLLDIFYRAWEIEATTPHLYEETRIWFRFNERQRQTKRDGLSIPQLGTDGVKRRLVEWTLRNGDPKRWSSPRSIRSYLKSTRKGIDSARGLVLLKTKSNEQVDWLRAGRAFARLALVLARLGLTSHPYSQVLQEYPEMAELQAEFNELLGVRDPEKIQMAIRVGRSGRAYAAPRRDPHDFLRQSPAPVS
jgi:Nitroreductase family